MKFAPKISLAFFSIGIISIVAVSFITYTYNSNLLIEQNKQQSELLSDMISKNIDVAFIEKTKTSLILANTPLIIEALQKSNNQYAELPKTDRQNRIQKLDSEWRNEKTNKEFFLEYTDNQISRYLKKQQSTLNCEYGEIFLTNKFGALVASTSKLTTFAHGHKNWWREGYNNGVGGVFFDDRGYDDSVDGYVVGIVVPIMDAKGIAGILKCNINIMGSINKIVLNHSDTDVSDLKLMRSGGLIIFEEGSEPLSTKIDPVCHEKIQHQSHGSFIWTHGDKTWMIGFSEIGITTNNKGYGFGGSSETIDHKKGNNNESWYLLDFRDMDIIMQPARESTIMMIIVIATISIMLAMVAFFLGKRFAQPVMTLSRHLESVAQGNFTTRINFDKKDEFGLLAKKFNFMTQELSRSTTTITRLESEIASRIVTEAKNEQLIKELQKNIAEIKTLQGMLPICCHCKKIRNDQGYWDQLEKYIVEHSHVEFSHGICPDCMQKYYPDIYAQMKKKENNT
jgi:methyl-accepting chemotaxis protein